MTCYELRSIIEIQPSYCFGCALLAKKPVPVACKKNIGFESKSLTLREFIRKQLLGKGGTYGREIISEDDLPSFHGQEASSTPRVDEVFSGWRKP